MMHVIFERRDGVDNRLLRHDRQIVVNDIAVIFARWRDRLVAAIVLPVALALLRSWVLDRTWIVAAATACLVSLTAGIAAARLVTERLAFHASDGLLAADALRPATGRRYAIAWQLVGLTVLGTVTLVVRAPLLVVSLPAYLAGALAGHALRGFGIPGRAGGGTRPGWTIRSWLRRPRAGIAAAAILAVSLFVRTFSIGHGATMAVVGLESVLLALALTTVDDALIRFMTVTGRGAWWIIARHARGMLLFLGLGMPLCLLGFGAAPAALLAGVAVAGLVLMATRIFAYRLHARRFADLLVLILAAMLALVATVMPALLPVAAVAILWHLHRRAAAKTWLLA